MTLARLVLLLCAVLAALDGAWFEALGLAAFAVLLLAFVRPPWSYFDR